ncbi:hypothetical protein IT570_08300 [Candidatus Sumerlaeota bacterium]|nr:hypothetical protein [Candidatus Sumerlaeota bacterium]
MSERKRWQPPVPLERESNLDLVALALTPWLLLVQGHSFGLGNYDTLLTFIRRINDPSYLGADWMLSTPAVHPALLGMIAPLCSSWGEGISFLVIHFLTRLILLCGVWRLVLALVPGGIRIAIIAMATTVLEPRFQLGSHYLQAGHWEPAYLGMAFAVWIIAEGIRLSTNRGHWITFTLVSGLGILSHLFICLPLFIITFTMICWKSSVPRRFLAVGFASVMFLGSSALLPAISGFFSPESTPLTSGDLIRILQFRHPHHHQPWSWPVLHYAEAFLLLGASTFAWHRYLRGEERRRLLLPAILMVYFIASCIVFTICGALQIVPFVAYLQCFRLLPLFVLIAMIGIYAMLDALLHKGMMFIAASLLVAMLLHYINWGGPFAVGLLALFLAMRSSTAPVDSKRSWRERKLLLMASAIVGISAIIALQYNPGLQRRANRLDPEHWLVSAEPDTQDRSALAQWIRATTPPDALFAVPPQMGYFRIWEKRAIVVDMKNIPYQNAAMKDWADRIKAAGVDDPYAPFTRPSLIDPDLAQMKHLAEQYRADYFVVRGKVDDGRDLFPGSGFSVFLLGDFDERINLPGVAR